MFFKTAMNITGERVYTDLPDAVYLHEAMRQEMDDTDTRVATFRGISDQFREAVIAYTGSLTVSTETVFPSQLR